MRIEMNDTMQELLQKSKNGDSIAFSLLYQETYKSVYFHAYSLLKKEEPAKDITQETFLIVYQSLGSLKDPNAFPSWIGGVVYRQVMMYFRKEKKFSCLEEDEVSDHLPTEDFSQQPEEALEHREFIRELSTLIEDLPEFQRCTLMAFYYDDMSIAEIVTLMECNSNTVKSRLSYAKKHLKQAILAKEKKTGIKLHSFSPALLLLCYQNMYQEMKFPLYLQQILWEPILKDLHSTSHLGGNSISTINITKNLIGKGVQLMATNSIKAKVVAAAIAVTLIGGGTTFAIYEHNQQKIRQEQEAIAIAKEEEEKLAKLAKLEEEKKEKEAQELEEAKKSEEQKRYNDSVISAVNQIFNVAEAKLLDGVTQEMMDSVQGAINNIMSDETLKAELMGYWHNANGQFHARLEAERIENERREAERREAEQREAERQAQASERKASRPSKKPSNNGSSSNSGGSSGGGSSKPDVPTPAPAPKPAPAPSGGIDPNNNKDLENF